MKEKRLGSENSGFVSKLSKGLMIPIALLPIAGLFLGIGAGISNIMVSAGVDQANPWYIVPDTISQIGSVIFANLPILFAIAVAIAFTNDAGVAAFSALVGWIVFSVTQSIFIWDQTGILVTQSNLRAITQIQTNWGVIQDYYDPLNGVSIAAANGGALPSPITMTQFQFVDTNGNGYIDSNELNNALLITKGTDITDIWVSQGQLQDFITWFNVSGNVVNNGEIISTTIYYNVLFYKDIPTSVVTSNVGILSMQTSVFGGICVGLVVAWIYNKFYMTQMPKVLGFFSGTKFVPIVTFVFIPLVGFAFLFTWPPIGSGLESFGQALGSVPYGIDAFIFGVVERALVPFGLHHAFYTPLWYTSAGGSFYVLNASGQVVDSAFGTQSIWFAMIDYHLNFNSALGAEYWVPFTSDLANSSGLTGGSWDQWTSGGWVIYSVGADGLIPANSYYFVMTSGTNPGEYMQGKYSFMIFGLPAAAAAMVMTSKKENRELALSILFAAAITTFLTGITEPLEFTFLFVAPMLYVFHVFIAGTSFWFADLMGCSIGMTFSGGIIDLALYGILPWATGTQGTGWWWVVTYGLFLIPVYYTFFYWYITKFDVKTPGRDNTAEIKLVSKVEYKQARAGASVGGGELPINDIIDNTLNSSDEIKSKDNATPETELYDVTKNSAFLKMKPERQERVKKLVTYLGGMENLDTISSCITRLRLVVNDRSKIQDDLIKSDLKASGMIGKDKSVHIIFGGEGDIFRSELLNIRNSMNK